MKGILSAASLVLLLAISAAAVFAAEPAVTISGEELFRKHCAVCHPKGGNIINSKKPIYSKALEARDIRKSDDIMKILRNPTPPMVKFDEKTLPDEHSKAIAEYVLSTF